MPEAALSQAAEYIAAGGVVLHATEGVWGFACDPFSESAVGRVLAIKARPVDKGLIVIGADTQQFAAELDALQPDERRLVLGTWPGSVSWVVPNVRFPNWVTGGRTTVAVRVPGHPQARALAALFGGPLVSTSANRSGEPAVLSESDARAQFSNFVDLILSGEVLDPGSPSALHTLDGQRLR